ncbi:hypothetical protein [Klebsiella michiganensis]|uniref:hypothetical protein n=1 Tax=Klebsiella michiganensis TaxID=1134687 RepID=UPI0007CC3A9E|nr:hypothetical protein [Klebsiella michiganensis]EKV5143711.1 hypothetical protein [Klebsiella michiganensis]MBA4429908.1 hypothetical protein [Klebsiella michiganensis]MEB6467907.1 hypothetical protein [Klebsiella michiganensis]SAP43212.1 Uncharacterised protein [Klebsiella michiganensis]HBK4624707.1 hypothetical protein [Klebsiella michiganensis]
MTKSTITRERVVALIAEHSYDSALVDALEHLLAAMDSEPVAEVYQPQNAGICAPLGPSIRMLCPLEPGTNLYRHAQQPVVQKIMARLAYLLDEDQFHNIESMVLAAATQPAPVVPDDVLDALQKVARIHLDLNDFDGDRRGIAYCLGDAEESLIEVVNRRAAMLNGGNDE